MLYQNMQPPCAVILTTLSIEYQFVQSHLSKLHEETYKGTVYERGTFAEGERQWEVGIVQIGMGNANAAAEAERAIEYFHAGVVLLIGVAGGLKDVQIGDVVAATKVYGYEFGKAIASFEMRPEVGRSTHAMEQRAMAESKKSDWLQRVGDALPDRNPQVFVAPIAAGEKVVASTRSATWKFLRKQYGDALAVEMEGHGFLRAIHANHQVDALIIRGISNLIDDKSQTETPDSQVLAARNATAFAFEVLAKLSKNQLSHRQTPEQLPLVIKQGSEDMKNTSVTRVLAIFANPPGASRLRLDTEERVIREAIKLSPNSNNIALTTCPAATIRDLSWALLNGNYEVIHIAGHGSGKGLILANDAGGLFLVNQATLAELFQEYSLSIQCVILNACYSFTQGSLISSTIPFTIAADYGISDTAASKFSEGFYDALAAGKTIEHAFREGKRRIQFSVPDASSLPLLIKQGDMTAQLNPFPDTDRSEDDLEPFYFKDTKAVVGIALDLSASMKKSFINRDGEEINRLKEVQQSLNDVLKTARKSVQEQQRDREQSALEVFVYGFGLRNLGSSDLLSLIKASRQVITKDVVQEAKQRYLQEQQIKYQGYKGLGNFIKQFGVSNSVDRAQDILQQRTQSAVARRIWHEKRAAIEHALEQIGDTTVSIEEFVDLWGNSTGIFSEADELLFGDTPIVDVLTKVIKRFKRDLEQRDKDTKPIFLLISDGKYAHIDPLPLIEKLRAMGVIILSCIVSNKDDANPRELLHDPKPEWNQETRIMFEMASPLEEGTRIEGFLFQKGWVIHPGAKLFIQVNHSAVLKEFIRITLGQLEYPDDTLVLPRGW